MGALFSILSIVFSLAAFGFSIFLLVQMFQDEIWKGVVGLLCGFYALYYALFEFEHEKRQILGGWLLCAALSVGFRVLS